jgi:hypothetical protein
VEATTCGYSCHGGTNAECPSGQFCYASISNCPMVCSGGGTVSTTTTQAATTTSATTTTTTQQTTSSSTSATTTSINTGATVPTTTQGTTTTSTSITTQATSPSSCLAETKTCGAGNPCADPSHCCSQWGYCGVGPDYCGGLCCQNGPCSGGGNPPSPTPPTPNPPSPTPGSPPSIAADDSRLIAYVGNWQTCPTPQQTDAYTHMVIAFAVSYTWSPNQNSCSNTCNVAPVVPICENQNRQDLVDTWRAQGKKVILSFGGAGMGGSWSGDNNNCWDYCFGREETLATSLVNIVKDQRLDGIDIDYEYCYDIYGSQSGRCPQRTSNYSDEKAQTFLMLLTSKLRQKLDALGSGYELTHAPMDADLVPSSVYYQILKDQHMNLNFLMPQFYNGITKAVADGVTRGKQGRDSAISLYDNLANDLFPGEPYKVVFGFCVTDCSGTGSNTDGDQAVTILQDIKSYNNGQFYCNGGAFFWVADHDTGGGWSDLVQGEVMQTTGCSSSATTVPPTTTTSTAGTTTQVATTTTTSATATVGTTTTTPQCIARGINPGSASCDACCSGKCKGPKCA